MSIASIGSRDCGRFAMVRLAIFSNKRPCLRAGSRSTVTIGLDGALRQQRPGLSGFHVAAVVNSGSEVQTPLSRSVSHPGIAKDLVFRAVSTQNLCLQVLRTECSITTRPRGSAHGLLLRVVLYQASGCRRLPCIGFRTHPLEHVYRDTYKTIVNLRNSNMSSQDRPTS